MKTIGFELLAEICHHKMVELGKEFETRFAFDEVYDGRSDSDSVLSFLVKEDDENLKLLSGKLERWIICGEPFTWTKTEKLLISLRLSCATDSLPMLSGGSSSESPLVPHLLTGRSTEALLWAVTSFWYFRRHSFLPYAAEYLTGGHWRRY